MFPGQPACDDNGYQVSSVGIILVSMGSYTALSLWKCLIRCALLCTPHAESGCVCVLFFFLCKACQFVQAMFSLSMDTFLPPPLFFIFFYYFSAEFIIIISGISRF